ncbi:EamA family transporter [Streptomyces sp. NPDC056165]|uniref:EamA family transporter n=1 Tax=Streptomyces sp. NPDC056165 TaxID=3345733 RepID=UPI0035E062D6
MPGIVLRTPQALSPAVGLATGAPLLSSWSDTAVGAYMALVPMFIGYILFGWGLAHVPASTATTLSLLEPVVAAVLAVLVVGERLPLLGWGGIALVVCCLAVLTTPTRTAHLPQAATIEHSTSAEAPSVSEPDRSPEAAPAVIEVGQVSTG